MNDNIKEKIIEYKGCTITLERIDGVWYYNIIDNIIDKGLEFVSSFSESQDTQKAIIKGLKNEVDKYIENPKEYIDDDSIKIYETDENLEKLNKHEQRFNDMLEMFSDTGIWIKDNDLKSGVSYIYIENISDDNEDDSMFSFEPESTEYDDCYSTISSFFEENPDLKFCFTLDKAIQGNFIDWKEFCKRVDNKESFGDVFSL